jgi:hypothetical protein
MLDNILTELSSTFLKKELDKIKEADPEKYNQTLNMFLAAVNVGIHFLEESLEFREAFARIHNEFLKYPECRSTIKQALKAYHNQT